MVRSVTIAAVLLCPAIVAAAESARPTLVERVGNWRLYDHHGGSHELYRLFERRAIVIFGVSSESAAAEDDLRAAAKYSEDYDEGRIAILAIAPQPEDTRETLEKRFAEFEAIPVLADEAQIAAKSLEFTRVREAVVIDPNDWSMHYRGPLQNEAGEVHQDLRRVVFGLVAGYGGTPAAIESTGTPINYSTPDRTPTFTEDIAPLLASNCVKCHSEGNIAPFVMDGYRRVKGWAPMIRETVVTRRMPPWHADPQSAELSNGSALTPDEIRLIAAWVDAGAPRGDGEELLREASAKAASAGWVLGEPHKIVSLEAPEQIPAEGILDYRLRKIKVDVDEDKWVTAVEVRPTNYESTHHIVVTLTYPEDRKDEQPEWWSDSGGYFGIYVPGIIPVTYPKGTARYMPKGSTLEFQLHYTTTGKAGEDRTALGLHFLEGEPEREFKTVGMRNFDIAIPAKASDHEEIAYFVMPEDGYIWGLNPHMHFRGSRFSYTAEYPDGHKEVLLSIPHYDFNWQTEYRFAKPVRLPAGTRITGVAGFNNSASNPHNPDPTSDVRWGDQSWDEMLVGYISYTPADHSTDD